MSACQVIGRYLAGVRAALDATALLGARTGVATFTYGALSALNDRPDVEAQAFGLSWRGRSLLREHLPPGVVSGWSVPAAPLLRLWAHSDLVTAELIMDQDDPPDVVHGTNFVVPPARRAARVVTVHDLTCVRYPQLCTPTSRRYPALIRRALGKGVWVHTPTQSIAAEVCDTFGADPSRVRAVAHGVGLPSDASDATEPGATAEAGAALAERLTGCRRYIAALGTIEPRKDFPGLVRAFDRLAGTRPDVGLVIAGPDGWGTKDLEAALAAARHRDRIGRAGYIAGPDRIGLLTGAAVFAYPSVYEGFGFPPVEAMALGVPVVASASGAVAEVCGDAADLVPVGDDEALSGALAGILDGGPTKVDTGLARAAGFTWERCAEGLVDLYRDAAAAA
jgi:glycosyltransferase involved in cell wall biosynthesis